MDFETGSRLASLRKENGYSQETLAEKLGISRQAVSKWERGESSPDTDNLIALAALYSMSLDELLGMETADNVNQTPPCAMSDTVSEPLAEQAESVQSEKQEQTAPSPVTSAVYAQERVSTSPEVLTEKPKAVREKKVREKPIREKKAREKKPALYPGLSGKLMKFPFLFIIGAIYVALAYYTKLWHPLWLITTLIPVYYWFVLACRAKTRRGFLMGMPVFPLAALSYLATGILTENWTKPLMILLIIPIYYWFAAASGKKSA